MIFEVISKYHQLSKLDKHHRFKSWEHCFNFFTSNYKNLHDAKAFDHGCLHLGFYLASWGMLRASFLLQKNYRVHEYFIRDIVMEPDYQKYFDPNFLMGSEEENIRGMNTLKKETINIYKNNVTQINGQKQTINITDTLASKILLGVFGIVPAYDRYFKEGLKIHGLKQRFNESSLRELINFYHSNRDDFERCRLLFKDEGTVYTPMKLIDMYFWQVGFLMDNPIENRHELEEIYEFASIYARSHEYQETKKNKVNPIRSNGLTETIRQYITELLINAKEEGYTSIDLKSGDIHKSLGLSNRVPPVCNAMVSLGTFKYEILHDTPSGASTTRLVRYYLN